MFKFHELMDENKERLARLIMKENGKNLSEALAEVAKGNETVEWATSLPQMAQVRVVFVAVTASMLMSSPCHGVPQGHSLQVSRGVTCVDVREPLGIVASICPFNFPVMVPMWTVPIALTMGNWWVSCGVVGSMRLVLFASLEWSSLVTLFALWVLRVAYCSSLPRRFRKPPTRSRSCFTAQASLPVCSRSSTVLWMP